MNFAATVQFSRVFLKTLQRVVKLLLFLHFVVAQRAERELIEAAGKEDGEGVWWRASGLEAPYPKRWHI